MWQYKMLVRLGNLHASRILLNCRCNLLPGSLPCRSTQQVSNEVTNIPTGVCRSGSRQDSHSMNFSILVFYLTLTWSYLPSITYSTKVPPDTTNNNASAANSQNESAQNMSVDECTCQDLHVPTAEVDGNNQSIDNRNVQQYALETLAEDSDDHEVRVTPEPMQVDTQQNSTQSSSNDVSHHRGATGNSITTDHGLNECVEAYSPRAQRRSARSDSISHQGAVKVEIEANETTDYTCPSAVQGNAANPRSIQMLDEFQLETPQREVQDGSRSHGKGLADMKLEANETNESNRPNTFLTNTTDKFSNQQFDSQGVSEKESEIRGRGPARVKMETNDNAEFIWASRGLRETPTTDISSNQGNDIQRDAQNDSQSRSQGMVRLKKEVNQGLSGGFERPQPDLSTATNTSSPQCIDRQGTTQNNAQCRGHGMSGVQVEPATTAEVSWTRPVRRSVPDHYNKGYEVNQGTSHQGSSRNDHMRVKSESNPRHAQLGTSRVDAHLPTDRDQAGFNPKFKTRLVTRVSPYHRATNRYLNRKGEVHRVAASETATHNDCNAHGQRPVEVHMEDNQIPESRLTRINRSLRQVSCDVPVHGPQQGRYHQGYTRNPRPDIARADQAESPGEHLGHTPVCDLNQAANEDEALSRPAYAQDSFRDIGAVTGGAGGVVNRNTGSRESSIMNSFPSGRDEGITRPNRHGMSTDHPNLPRDDPQPLLRYEYICYYDSVVEVVSQWQRPVPRLIMRHTNRYQILEMSRSILGMLHPDRIPLGMLLRRYRTYTSSGILSNDQVSAYTSTGILSNDQVSAVPSDQYHLISTPIWGACTRCRRRAMVRHIIYDGSSNMICVTCHTVFEIHLVVREIVAANRPSTRRENLAQLPPTTAYSDNNAVASNSQTLTTHRDNGNSSRSRLSSRVRNSQRTTSHVHIRNNKNSRNLYSRRAP